MDSQDTQPNPVTESFAAPAGTGENERHTQSQDAPREYADEYPAYLRLTRDLPVTTPYEFDDFELRHIPPGNQDSGWQNCLNSVERYDRDLCQTYREQIDTLLVFAGLFSAVVTAFAVESYSWLQDDPVDTSVELLRDVVYLLSQNLNITAPSVPKSPQRLSGAAIARINSFWFLSLMLSLSAALVGILCKQWLREFERSVGQSPEKALAVRFIRFQGLQYWKVGSIVTSVPIIMQMALAFFIIGVVELLWRLHTVVACCVTTAAGLTLAFYLATTFLPVIQYVYICMRCYIGALRTRDYALLQAYTEPQCAFKSSQAWLALRVVQPIIDRLLKANGYQFSSYHPQAFVDRTLRRTDSWTDFDLNWVKCRENTHNGPSCAFESLTWLAASLGEMHLGSWIWHCVWARWLQHRDYPDDFKTAMAEIDSVTRAYPRMVAVGTDHTTLVRSQALVFQCSLRTDIPIGTALELLLRVAAVLGPGSHWTRGALHAARMVYRDHYICLDDDIAVGLFRLAELQIHAIIYVADGPSSEKQYNAAVAFRSIVAILHRGTRLRDTFMPAMAGLVLQWLRSRPPRLVGLVGRAVFQDMLRYLVSQGLRGAGLQNLRSYRDIMFIAKLAGAVVELWPDERRVYKDRPDECALLWELLGIFSEGLPELSQDHSHASMEPHQDTTVNANRESSTPPAPDRQVDPHTIQETHTEPLGSHVHADGESQPPTHAHTCIDVHVETEAAMAKTDAGENGPSSPVNSLDACAANPQPHSS